MSVYETCLTVSSDLDFPTIERCRENEEDRHRHRALRFVLHR
jgi:hypothetical protein